MNCSLFCSWVWMRRATKETQHLRVSFLPCLFWGRLSSGRSSSVNWGEGGRSVRTGEDELANRGDEAGEEGIEGLLA